ncbi:hypothetical protein ACQCU1_07490 [Sutcliffiella horikoshii]|nr:MULTISPECIES: hypothetical protein [Bacillaceae]
MKKQLVLLVMAVFLVCCGAVEFQEAGVDSKQEILLASKDQHPDPIPEG